MNSRRHEIWNDNFSRITDQGLERNMRYVNTVAR